MYIVKLLMRNIIYLVYVISFMTIQVCVQFGCHCSSDVLKHNLRETAISELGVDAVTELKEALKKMLDASKRFKKHKADYNIVINGMLYHIRSFCDIASSFDANASNVHKYGSVIKCHNDNIAGEIRCVKNHLFKITKNIISSLRCNNVSGGLTRKLSNLLSQLSCIGEKHHKKLQKLFDKKMNGNNTMPSIAGDYASINSLSSYDNQISHNGNAICANNDVMNTNSDAVVQTDFSDSRPENATVIDDNVTHDSEYVTHGDNASMLAQLKSQDVVITPLCTSLKTDTNNTENKIGANGDDAISRMGRCVDASSVDDSLRGGKTSHSNHHNNILSNSDFYLVQRYIPDIVHISNIYRSMRDESGEKIDRKSGNNYDYCDRCITPIIVTGITMNSFVEDVYSGRTSYDEIIVDKDVARNKNVQQKAQSRRNNLSTQERKNMPVSERPSVHRVFKQQIEAILLVLKGKIKDNTMSNNDILRSIKSLNKLKQQYSYNRKITKIIDDIVLQLNKYIQPRKKQSSRRSQGSRKTKTVQSTKLHNTAMMSRA